MYKIENSGGEEETETDYNTHKTIKKKSPRCLCKKSLGTGAVGLWLV